MNDVLRVHIDEQRIDAAQKEWERWKRANGVAAAGIRMSATELRKIAKRMGETRDERDIERMAATLDACAEQLDGETWLKSPLAMAEQRKLENTT